MTLDNYSWVETANSKVLLFCYNLRLGSGYNLGKDLSKRWGLS